MLFNAELIFNTANYFLFSCKEYIKHVTYFLQGLHALFTGEDDTWDAWLNVPSSGFAGIVSFGGTGIQLRRGYAPSRSPKPTQVYFQFFSIS